MLFKFRLLLATVIIIIATQQTTRADVTLVSKGKARAAIYVAPRVMAADADIAIDVPWAVRSQETPAQRTARENEAQRRCLRESVNDLARCLREMAGTIVPIHQRLPQKSTNFSEIRENAFVISACFCGTLTAQMPHSAPELR